MKLHLENTDKLTTLIVRGHEVPARIWEGHTDSGIEVHAYITRIAVSPDSDKAQFEAELQEQRAASAEIEAIPLRLIL